MATNYGSSHPHIGLEVSVDISRGNILLRREKKEMRCQKWHWHSPVVVRFFLKEDHLTSPSMTSSSSNVVAHRHNVATRGSVHAWISALAQSCSFCYWQNNVRINKKHKYAWKWYTWFLISYLVSHTSHDIKSKDNIFTHTPIIGKLSYADL